VGYNQGKFTLHVRLQIFRSVLEIVSDRRDARV